MHRNGTFTSLGDFLETDHPRVCKSLRSGTWMYMNLSLPTKIKEFILALDPIHLGSHIEIHWGYSIYKGAGICKDSSCRAPPICLSLSKTVYKLKLYPGCVEDILYPVHGISKTNNHNLLIPLYPIFLGSVNLRVLFINVWGAPWALSVPVNFQRHAQQISHRTCNTMKFSWRSTVPMWAVAMLGCLGPSRRIQTGRGLHGPVPRGPCCKLVSNHSLLYGYDLLIRFCWARIGSIVIITITAVVL